MSTGLDLSLIPVWQELRGVWLAAEPRVIHGDLMMKRALWSQWYEQGDAVGLLDDGVVGYRQWLGKSVVPDLVKVGPKGYIHGWIYVGPGHVGAEVLHPELGSGKLTRVGKKTHGVRFASGAEHAFEHAPETPAPEHFVARTSGRKPSASRVSHTGIRKPTRDDPTFQAEADRKRTISDFAARMDQIVHDGASERALRHTIDSAHSSGDLTDAEHRRFIEAIGNPKRLHTAVDGLRRRHGLTIVGGRSGETHPFDRTVHEPIGTDMPNGAPVTVLRPGHDTALSNGENIRVRRAVVMPAGEPDVEPEPVMRSSYYADPTNARAGVIDTMPMTTGDVLITRVLVAPESTGAGHAQQLLRQITTDADRAGKTLVLEVQPYPGTDRKRLTELYQRYGFTWDDRHGGRAAQVMFRTPAPSDHKVQQSAIDRQRDIDTASVASDIAREFAGEERTALDNGMTRQEAASHLGERIESAVADARGRLRAGGELPDGLDEVEAAAKARDLDRLRQAVNDLAIGANVSMEGMPYGKARYNPARHQLLSGDPTEDDAVTILHPGTVLHRDGEKIQLERAHVIAHDPKTHSAAQRRVRNTRAAWVREGADEQVGRRARVDTPDPGPTPDVSPRQQAERLRSEANRLQRQLDAGLPGGPNTTRRHHTPVGRVTTGQGLTAGEWDERAAQQQRIEHLRAEANQIENTATVRPAMTPADEDRILAMDRPGAPASIRATAEGIRERRRVAADTPRKTLAAAALKRNPTKVESAAIDRYGGDGSYIINAALRSSGGHPSALVGQDVMPGGTTGILQDRHIAAIEGLDSLMASSPLPEDTRLYRKIGFADDVFGGMADSDLTGHTWVDHGFVSTRVAPHDQPHLVRMEMTITAPAGTPGFSHPRLDSDEVLLDRGLSYRITGDSGPGTQPRRLDVRVVPTVRRETEPPTAPTAQAVAAIRGSFPAPTGEITMLREYDHMISQAMDNPDYDKKSKSLNRAIKQVGEPYARRIAWEAEAEAHLANHLLEQQPEDPNVDPYADLPPMPAAEIAQGKVDATRELKQRFAGKKMIVRMRSDNLGDALRDGRLKNAFETGRSGGDSKGDPRYREKRARVEEVMFGIPLDAPPDKRPIYAYLTDGVHPVGADIEPGHASPGTYGDIQVVLKDTVRSRTTASVGDSMDDHALPSPVDDPKWYSTNHTASRYDEAQIHGGVITDDIAEVVFPLQPSAQIRADLDRAGVPWRVLSDQPTPEQIGEQAAASVTEALGQRRPPGKRSKNNIERDAQAALAAIPTPGRTSSAYSVFLQKQPVAVLRDMARLHGIVGHLGGREVVARMKKADLVRAMTPWFS